MTNGPCAADFTGWSPPTRPNHGGRRGMIRVDSFDQMLVDLRQGMK
jgi:hypothetical protein